MSNSDVLVLALDDGQLILEKNTDPFGQFSLSFTPYNVFDGNVVLRVSIHQAYASSAAADHTIRLKFVDELTDDIVYEFAGTLSPDENDTSSIVAVMAASEEFALVELFVDHDELESDIDGYNPVNTLGRNGVTLSIPSINAGTFDLQSILVNQDVPPSVMYMYFSGSNVQEYIAAQLAANQINVRLLVEFPPGLTIDQVIDYANNLEANDHHIAFIWSPIVARPVGATGLKGRKVPRTSGGAILGKYVLRNANTNSSGIPPLNRPVAGYDFPISYVGIEQAPGIVLDDTARKRLADAKINVVQRLVTPNGVRYILGDVLTSYNDNRSLLGLINSSDISMYIDNRIIEIVKRHLLKPTTNTINDATKEIKDFLDACTTKERQLLLQSDELGGSYYQISLTRRDNRRDAIDVAAGYHPESATRAAFLNTTVTA